MVKYMPVTGTAYSLLIYTSHRRVPGTDSPSSTAPSALSALPTPMPTTIPGDWFATPLQRVGNEVVMLVVAELLLGVDPIGYHQVGKCNLYTGYDLGAVPGDIWQLHLAWGCRQATFRYANSQGDKHFNIKRPRPTACTAAACS